MMISFAFIHVTVWKNVHREIILSLRPTALDISEFTMNGRGVLNKLKNKAMNKPKNKARRKIGKPAMKRKLRSSTNKAVNKTINKL